MSSVTIIHEELAKQGIPVLSVSEDGTMLFEEGTTLDQKKQAWLFVKNFKYPSRVEILEKIRENKDELLERLLLERFYPEYVEEFDRDAT